MNLAGVIQPKLAAIVAVSATGIVARAAAIAVDYAANH
jgi:hypothetical protein